MTPLLLGISVALLAILAVLVWIGLQVNRVLGILSFLSIRWQQQDDLVRDTLITHDMPDLPEPDDPGT